MNADHDRDRALDQALKAALGRRDDAPITPACLDAETLAAWMDGGLDAPSVAMAEAHAVELRAVPGPDRHAGPRHARGGGEERQPGALVAMVACAAGRRSRRRHAVDGRADRSLLGADPPKEIQQAAPESPPAQARDAAAPSIPAHLQHRCASAKERARRGQGSTRREQAGRQRGEGQHRGAVQRHSTNQSARPKH